MCMLTPWRLWIFHTDARPAFSTTVWMSIWMHGSTTNCWSPPQKSIAPGLPHLYGLPFNVSKLSNGCDACTQHQTQLFTWHQEGDHITFFTLNERAGSGTSNHLSAFSRTNLNIVNWLTNRDLTQRQCIPNSYFGFWPTHHDRSDDQTLWSKDVALLTIAVIKQSNVGGAHWVVLD